MKILRFLGCMIIGHNKILEHRIENGYDIYFTICSQCGKKWHMEQLSEIPKTIRITHSIKMRDQGKKISTLLEPQIAVLKKIPKKHFVNIYLI